MNAILTIAGKDLRLLRRDSRSAVILLLMPLALILILGVTLGDVFGKKPDQIRVTVVVLDEGLSKYDAPYPPKPWAEMVLDDLQNVGQMKIERVTLAEGERLIDSRKRSAVVVFDADFSQRAQRCSFIGSEFKRDPLNPLDEYGVQTELLGVRFLKNSSQPIGAAVIRQVVQVSLLRVIIPWMIGQAFGQVGSEKFMDKMVSSIPGMSSLFILPGSKKRVGDAIQDGISRFFSDYKFTAYTWAGLVKKAPVVGANGEAVPPPGFTLARGDTRYKVLVPSYTVTFAFFLVLTVGWLFVVERRHGTITRLRAAPISRGQILFGKLLPCLAVSIAQGALLLIAGKVVFGMTWGPEPWLLIPLVFSTSLAAVGLALLVAGVARTETQVAVYGTLLVLLLALVSGSLMPRDMMPPEMQQVAQFTPHDWALDAYAELLNPDHVGNDPPPVNVARVLTSCGVLVGFAALFLSLAWWKLSLD